MAHRLTTCTFCGVGCGLYLETSGNQVVGAYPSMSHPTSSGRLCVRGWHIHEVASSRDRVTRPLIREEGHLREGSWDEALGLIVERLSGIVRRHGSDAVAFLNGPRCSNEESYLLQKLARTVVGTNNVDHGAGVYCHNSVSVLLRMLGVSAATNSISELERSDVIVVDSVDLARQLPTVGGVVLRAKLRGAKLLVIGERRDRIAEHADIFLQLVPGTDALLYGAMAKVIVDRGLANIPFVESRCRGYEAFLASVREYDLLEAAQACGVDPAQVEAAAVAYARAGTAAILYSTGVEAREPEAIEGLVNLALLTGQIGREGAGIFPLTEHNNLQGVCDTGVMPDRLPGYRSVTDDSARGELETLWGTRLPSRPGLSASQALAQCGDSIKALWLSRYDPLNAGFFGDTAASLERCDLLVAQCLFLTEAARHAHVVLPVAGYGEERVTFTSTERRIQLAERVVDPPPGIVPSWRQLADVASALGGRFSYGSSESVMREIGEAVPFYSGASYDNLAREYGRQWPCTHDRPLGSPILFADAAHSPPFSFVGLPKPNPPPPAPQDYPLTLVFGRSLYYWDNNALIRRSETLKREYRILLLDYPEGFVEIHPDDAKRLAIRDGELVRITAQSGGNASVAARITHEVRVGTVFVPYFVRQVHEQIHGRQGNGGDEFPVRVERGAVS